MVRLLTGTYRGEKTSQKERNRRPRRFGYDLTPEEKKEMEQRGIILGLNGKGKIEIRLDKYGLPIESEANQRKINRSKIVNHSNVEMSGPGLTISKGNKILFKARNKIELLKFIRSELGFWEIDLGDINRLLATKQLLYREFSIEQVDSLLLQEVL